MQKQLASSVRGLGFRVEGLRLFKVLLEAEIRRTSFQ